MHSLMYHDVLSDPANPDSSGFPGADAAVYKVDGKTFLQHLDELASKLREAPAVLRGDEEECDLRSAESWCLTFDDGGVSASTDIADALEAHGWRGHFFITTERIGQSGFLERSQIKDLSDRGHVIGTHSHTHPPRLSSLTDQQIATEWKTSREILEDLIGRKARVASVPGGFYSQTVGRTAVEAGIRILFTSSPKSHPERIGDGWLLGRYAIKDTASAQAAAALARGAFMPVLLMRLQWSLRGIAKRLGGQAYLDIRKAIMNMRARNKK